MRSDYYHNEVISLGLSIDTPIVVVDAVVRPRLVYIQRYLISLERRKGQCRIVGIHGQLLTRYCDSASFGARSISSPRSMILTLLAVSSHSILEFKTW